MSSSYWTAPPASARAASNGPSTLPSSCVMHWTSTQVRVGVLQFSSKPRLEFSLESYSTRQEVKEKIKKIVFKGGSTETGLALKYVLRKGFPGGRDASIPKILILLSDGKSQGDLRLPVKQLKASTVTVFAVGVKYPRWEELHTLASDPTEKHVLFAEHADDAVNGLSSTLTTSDLCSAVPPGCQIESHPCERKTLETVKELTGNFMCWKGANQISATSTGLCPFYSFKRFFTKHPSTCHRTVCPDPCDSQPCQNGGTCVLEGFDKYHCICPVGFGGDANCAPKLSLECSVDLLFLVDSSAITTLEGFLRHKSFLKRFIQAVMTSDSPVNVGVAQYSSEVRMVVRIGEYRDVSELLKYIDAMRFMGGSLFTGKALRQVTQHGFKSTPVFADVRDDLPRVVVLLAGSKSQDSVTDPAKYGRDREVFFIGVGSDTLKTELDDITGNMLQTITYSRVEGLHNKIHELHKKICTVDNLGCQAQSLDLVFTLDASAGVGRENFNRLKNFIERTSLQFDINRDVTQIGLVTYGSRPRTVFPLDAHDSSSSLLQAIGRASFIGGLPSTGSALLHVYSDVMTIHRGARPGVNKAVVVISDGSGAEDAAVPAQKLRNNGVSIFVIGIGDVQRTALLRIAGADSYVLQVPSYEDLVNFEDLIVQRVCEEAKRPVNLCRPNPCMNEGVCILRGGSYRCDCRGWEGPHCERKIARGDSPRPSALFAPPQRQRHHRHLSRGQHRKRHAQPKH
ncbi:von Willebrand factor A domain-containing protein 2 isoform X2 [Ambystoma mexicanum]|uniref:von Willebrand factor A domain-containing protein 2 isoform X2 n=1 Tax=Ambystoma mexicanum TaxID=8296 RepID=UPI0037E73420